MAQTSGSRLASGECEPTLAALIESLCPKRGTRQTGEAEDGSKRERQKGGRES